MFLETAMVYPAPRYPADGEWNAAEFQAEDVNFASGDGTQLHGWYWEYPNPRAHVVYFHGNGDCVGYLGHYMAGFSQVNEVSVFAFDYRGYGRSHGKPHERGVLQDGGAARNWLANRVMLRPVDMVLLGRSLGGAVAVHLAQSGARGLILQNTFTTLPDVAAHLFWYLPVRLLMRNQYRSIDKISNYCGPLLQSHGTKDRVIPFELGQRLFDRAVGDKTFISLPDCDHNDPEPSSYVIRLKRFLDSLAPLRLQTN